MRYSDEYIAKRKADAQIDLARLATGWRPSKEFLDEHAVKLGEWSLEPTADGKKKVLQGIAQGHPTLTGIRQIWTSHVVWIDRDAKLARTLGHWYRLGSEWTAEKQKAHEEHQTALRAARAANPVPPKPISDKLFPPPEKWDAEDDDLSYYPKF